MFRFNLSRRLPKKPLLGLAVLALALVAAGGGAAHQADAQTPPARNLVITFNSISFPKLNDCNWLESNCNTADLYGKLTAVTNSGVSGGRELAYGGYYDPEAAWEDPTCGQGCLKLVHQGDVKLFKGTNLCTMPNAYAWDYQIPWQSCQHNNNSFVLTVHAGETITISSSLYDYDKSSADDAVCVHSMPILLTQAMVAPGASTPYSMVQGFNGKGSCTLSFTLTGTY